ncbi:MAG: DUF1549 domain-containing protein [Planctomycetaceae bacterium]|nr:DUF1549 domain-containing protein [Planctomycetaceae bacterium]
MRGSWVFVALCAVMVDVVVLTSSSAAEPAGAEQAVPLNDRDVIQLINRELRQIWDQAQLRPSPKATEAEWCRRVFIDLIGRVPTVAELNIFLAEPGDRRTTLVDRLLGEAYQTEYSQHWAMIYGNLLIGRPYTAKSRATAQLADRAAFTSYLARSFAENKPYDRLVTELLTAEGSISPGAADFNPAANYLVDKLKNDAIEATAKTGNTFLAVRMQCFQCHCAPFSSWNQHEYWELNAFFRQSKVVQTSSPSAAAPRIINTDFVEGIVDPKRAEVQYELRCGQSRVAFPKMLRGPEGNPSGLLSDVNRREELARFLVQNERFALAQVNRVWKHFLSYSFSGYRHESDDALDCLGAFEPLSRELARQFIIHNYDNRRLLRWIALSEPYGLSSKVIPANKGDDPELGVRSHFSHFYVRMLEPEVVYAAINTVRTQGATESIDWRQYIAERNEALANFTQSLENDEGELVSHPKGDPNQTLQVFNGRLTQQCLRLDESAILGKLKLSGKQNREIVEFLFLAAYGRKPTSGELKQLAQAIRTDRVDDAHQDLLWSLINSNEFLFVY